MLPHVASTSYEVILSFSVAIAFKSTSNGRFFHLMLLLHATQHLNERIISFSGLISFKVVTPYTLLNFKLNKAYSETEALLLI